LTIVNNSIIIDLTPSTVNKIKRMMNEMANYKGIKFNNSMDEFKRWSKEFPPMDQEAVKAVGLKKHDNYYLELQLVQGFLTDDSFVSASVREYDPEDKNFEYVGVDIEKELLGTVFKSKVESFAAKHNAPFYK
jgi:hypothetical protein